MAQAPRQRLKNTRRGCKKGLESYEPHWPTHGLLLDNCVLFCVLAMPDGARIPGSQRAPGIPVLRAGGYGTLRPSRNLELLVQRHTLVWYSIPRT